MVADVFSRYVPQERQKDYEVVEEDLRLLIIQYSATPEIINLLKYLAQKQEQDPKHRAIKKT